MTKNIEYMLSTDVHAIDVYFTRYNYIHNNIPIKCRTCKHIRNTTGHPGANCIEKENTVHTK